MKKLLCALTTVLLVPVALTVTTTQPASAAEHDFTVTSYNVKNNYVPGASPAREYPASDAKSWEKRLPKVVTALSDQYVHSDVITLQEAGTRAGSRLTQNPTDQLRDRLNAKLPQRSYKSLTGARSMLYDSKKVTLVKQGTIATDASYTNKAGNVVKNLRDSARWAVLQPTVSGAKRVLVLSVHLEVRASGFTTKENKSEQLRGKEMRQIIAQANRIAAADLGGSGKIVYSGDFNTHPDRLYDGAGVPLAETGNTYRSFDVGRRIDSRLACRTATLCVNLGYETFNGFGKATTGKERLDRVFVSTHVAKVVKYKNFIQFAGLGASDHFPVKAWLAL